MAVDDVTLKWIKSMSEEIENRQDEAFNSFMDVINPAHYNGTEVDDFIASQKLNFRLGCVVKYVSRAGKKQGASYIDDLNKAKWYIEREIEKHGE